jgi:hypothetical protein
MFKKSLLASALIALLSISAHATTIDFEASGSPGTYNNLGYAIDGFVFNYTMDNIDISPSATWYGTGPAHSGSFAALNNWGGTGELSLLGGGTFSFQNLWLKGWYGDINSVSVTGYLGGNEVGSVSGSLSNGWGNYVGNFSSIDKLAIVTSGIFLVDDISVNSTMAPVPEPETYAMLMAGLGLLGAVTRRRKSLAA